MRNRLKPHSFRTKVIIAAMICIAFPTIITLSVYNYLSKDAVQEQAVLNSNRELDLIDGSVSKLLDDMLYITNFIQIDSELNAILKNKNATEPDEVNSQEAYGAYINDTKVLKTIENITLVGEKSYVTILLTNGKTYTNYPVSEYEAEKMFQEPWFKELNSISGYESVWIGTQPTVFASEKRDSPYQISVGRTLRSENSRIYGYVVVTMMENKIRDVFKSRDRSEDIFLLNEENRILSHTDQERIGDTFPAADRAGRVNQTEVVHLSGDSYLMSKKQTAFEGWSLVSLIPYERAVFKLNSIFKNIFLIQIVLFVVFAVILTYLMKTLTNPLVKMGKVVERVESGEMSARTGIRNEDEIGRLSASFDHMLDRINEMIVEITDTQVKKREAELAMLQAQINPHFLFNVLNSIRMKLIGKGDRESAEMISSLSKLLRMTIDKDKGIISLQQEIDMVTDFVRIMNMRQKEKAILHVRVSKEVHDEKIPRFVLQPIIENSMIHGLSQSGGTIHIHSFTDGQYCIIEVADDGQGMDARTLSGLRERVRQTAYTDIPDPKEKKGFSSLGLSNVYQRLWMTFGGSFRMAIESSPGNGTKITLYIPKQGGEE